MNYKIASILFIYCLLNITLYKSIIVPDKQNPIIFKHPISYRSYSNTSIFNEKNNNNIIESELILTFKFINSDNTISKNQFFGIRFSNISTNLLEYYNRIGIVTDNKYSMFYSLDIENIKYNPVCSLTDLKNKNYNLEFYFPSIGRTYSSSVNYINEDLDDNREFNVIYCKYLEDYSLKNNVDYSLKITFYKKFYINYITGIGLFTATYNNIYKQYLNILPVFGNLSLYNLNEDEMLRIRKINFFCFDNDISFYISKNNKNETTNNNETNSICNGYYNENFNLEIEIEFLEMFSLNNYKLIIELPEEIIKSNKSEQTFDYTIFIDKYPNSILKHLEKNKFVIENLYNENNEEDYSYYIKKGEIINIKLINLKINFDYYYNHKSDNDIYIKTEVLIINSYSLISYSFFPMPKLLDIIFENPTNNSYTNFKIENNELEEIYENSIYSLSLSFKLIGIKNNLNSKNRLDNGAYVTFQHSNANDNKSILNLIASTCDISYQITTTTNNKQINNNFNSIIFCNVITSNFNYITKDKNINKKDDNYLGSGIWVYLPFLSSDIIYNIKLMFYAEKCGETSNLNNSNIELTKESNSLSFFRFNLNIYLRSYESVFNEKKFYELISTVSFDSNIPCLSTLLSGEESINHYDDLYSTINHHNINLEEANDNIKNSFNEYRILKEITNFSLITNSKNYNNCMFYDNINIKDSLKCNIVNPRFTKSYIDKIIYNNTVDKYDNYNTYNNIGIQYELSYNIKNDIIKSNSDSDINLKYKKSIASYFPMPIYKVLDYEKKVYNYFYQPFSIDLRINSEYLNIDNNSAYNNKGFFSWQSNINKIKKNIQNNNKNKVLFPNNIDKNYIVVSIENKLNINILLKGNDFNNYVYNSNLFQHKLNLDNNSTSYINSETEFEFLNELLEIENNLIINESTNLELKFMTNLIKFKNRDELEKFKPLSYNQNSISIYSKFIYEIIFKVPYKYLLVGNQNNNSYILSSNYKDRITTRVLRFVTYKPLPGIFWNKFEVNPNTNESIDVKLTNKKSQDTVKSTYKLYFGYNNNETNQGICIIHVDNYKLNKLFINQKETISLAFWLFNINMLDTSYNLNKNSEYVHSDEFRYYPTTLFNNSYLLKNQPISTNQSKIYKKINNTSVFDSNNYYLNKNIETNEQLEYTEYNYYIIFGSLLLSENINKSLLLPDSDGIETKENFYIPIICPNNPHTNISNNLNNIKSFIGGFSYEGNYIKSNSINSKDTNINFQKPFKFISNHYNQINYEFPKKNFNNNSSNLTNWYKATLKFNSYSDSSTNSEDLMYIFNSTLRDKNDLVYCNAFVFLISARINKYCNPNCSITYNSSYSLLKSNELSEFKHNNLEKDSYHSKADNSHIKNNNNNISNKYKIHFQNKEFYSLLVHTDLESNNVLIKSNAIGFDMPYSLESKSDIYTTGILRPNISVFDKHKKYHLLDSVAFYCHSDNLNVNNILTNYINYHESDSFNYDFFYENIFYKDIINEYSNLIENNYSLNNTNLKLNTNKYVGFYLLDFNTDASIWNPSMKLISTDIYKNDKGGMFYFSISPQTSFLKNSIIEFKSPFFNEASYCYLNFNFYNGKALNNLIHCKNIDESPYYIISCNLSREFSNKSNYNPYILEICCYNIEITNKIIYLDHFINYADYNLLFSNQKHFDIKNSLNYIEGLKNNQAFVDNLNNNILENNYIPFFTKIISKYLNTETIKPPTFSGSTPYIKNFVKSFESLKDVEKDILPKIINIKFDFVNQIEGIGAIILEVDIVRQIVPNMVVIIEGDFTDSYLQDINQNCYAEFKFNEQNNVYIESCNTGNIKYRNNSIQIVIKKDINKCSNSYVSENLDYKNILVVNLFPVKLFSLSGIFSKMKFKVNLINKDSSSFLSSINYKGFNIEVEDSYLNSLQKPPIGRWVDKSKNNYLCEIIKIEPPLFGDYSNNILIKVNVSFIMERIKFIVDNKLYDEDMKINQLNLFLDNNIFGITEFNIQEKFVLNDNDKKSKKAYSFDYNEQISYNSLKCFYSENSIDLNLEYIEPIINSSNEHTFEINNNINNNEVICGFNRMGILNVNLPVIDLYSYLEKRKADLQESNFENFKDKDFIKDFYILLSGISISHIKNNIHKYVCSISNYNNLINKRYNIINGYGIIDVNMLFLNHYNNIYISSTNKNLGNTNIDNTDNLSGTKENNLNKQEVDTINNTTNTIKLGKLIYFNNEYDNSNNLINVMEVRSVQNLKISFKINSEVDYPYNIINNSKIYLSFLDNYLFLYNKLSANSSSKLNNSIKLNLKIINIIENNESSLLQNEVINVSNINSITVNNQIIINLNSKITLKTKASYILITLIDFPTYFERSFINTFINITLISLYSNNNNNNNQTLINKSIFTTYTNINNYHLSNLINKQSKSPYIIYNKGLAFDFNNKEKYIIDIKSLNYLNINTIIIQAGRFFKYFFVLRQLNINKINNNKDYDKQDILFTEISIKDAVFITDKEKYSLFTIGLNQIEFKIGTLCNTNPGKYVLSNIYISNTSKFYNFPIMSIELNKESLGVVYTYRDFKLSSKVKGTISIPPASSVFLFYSLSEPSIDSFFVKWTKFSNNADITANIKSSEITNNYYITEIITRNPFISESLFFLGESLNNCYKLEYNVLEVIISGAITNAEGLNIISSFAYYNANDDHFYSKSLNQKNNISLHKNEQNSIKFVYKPSIFPIKLFCSLVCYANEFTDDKLLSSLNYIYSNPKLEYIYVDQIIDSNLSNIVFSNLIRGEQYKLKCMAYSVDSLIMPTKSYALYNTFTNSSVSYIPITVKENEPTSCIEFLFDEQLNFIMNEDNTSYINNYMINNNLNYDEDSSDYINLKNNITYDLTNDILNKFYYDLNDNNNNITKDKFENITSIKNTIYKFFYDILNLCQETFISNGYEDNGCITCYDSLDKTIKGFKLVENIQDKCPFSIYRKKSTSVVEHVVGKTGNNTSYSLFESNEIESFKVHTKIKELISSKSYSYKICGIQLDQCKTDVSIGNKNYKDLFYTFASKAEYFITSKNIEESEISNNFYNINNILKINLKQIAIIEDIYKPDFLKDVNVLEFMYDSVNKVISFYAKSDKSLKCYYRIDDINSIFLVTYKDMIHCSEQKILCGSYDIFKNWIYVEIDVNKLKIGKYSIYNCCSNNVPRPQLFSDIVISQNFKINSSNEYIKNEDLDVIKNNNSTKYNITDVNQTDISSNKTITEVNSIISNIIYIISYSNILLFKYLLLFFL